MEKTGHHETLETHERRQAEGSGSEKFPFRVFRVVRGPGFQRVDVWLFILEKTGHHETHETHERRQAEGSGSEKFPFRVFRVVRGR